MSWFSKVMFWLVAWAVYIRIMLKIGTLDDNFNRVEYWVYVLILSLFLILINAMSFSN